MKWYKGLGFRVLDHSISSIVKILSSKQTDTFKKKIQQKKLLCRPWLSSKNIELVCTL
jgi:hypothetical protein